MIDRFHFNPGPINFNTFITHDFYFIKECGSLKNCFIYAINM